MLGLLLIVALIWLSAPVLLWMYHIDRAGALLERGLEQPRHVPIDRVAVARDRPAIDAALGHLDAAIRLRPAYIDAYRMAADALAASGAWVQAADRLAQAQRIQPANKTLAWQHSLMLEGKLAAVSGAPRETILPDLASVPVQAPSQSVATPHCRLGDAASCYVGLTRIMQPLAALPDGPAVAAEALFMHADSSVTLNHTLYADHPVLSFMTGLDPAKRDGHSDGATFEIWAARPGAERTRLFAYAMDAETARRGWVAHQLDLRDWAGNGVELTFRTGGGAAGDTVDDWLVWGDVTLTTADAAQPELRLDQVLMRQAWINAGLDAGMLMTRGDEDLIYGRVASASAWYKRAFISDPDLRSTSAVFRAQVAHIAAVSSRLDSLPLDPVLIHDVAAGVTINGTDLQWLASDPEYNLDYGSTLGSLPGPDPALGVMWWSGRALTVVNVETAGTYHISLRARDDAPAPTELRIEHNFMSLDTMTLTRGDGSSALLSLSRHFEPGLHVLGVSFLNNGAVNGVDRNASIESIEIVPAAPGRR